MSAGTKPCTAWWTEPNGGLCSYAAHREIQAGGAPGAHHCSATKADHVECVCVCGAAHKRPVDHAARFEARQGQGRAALTIDGAGNGQISVMGVDISNAVGGGTLEFEAGRGTVLRVAMPLVAAFARGEIELDDATAGALLAIGWTSPEQAKEADQLRRRDLQEALGGLGTVLREWGDLLDVVRQMNDILDEVPVSMGGRNEG